MRRNNEGLTPSLKHIECFFEFNRGSAFQCVRLRWLPRMSYVNPLTGLETSQRAGLYWIPRPRAGTWTSERVLVPNFVPQQVTQTSYVPETVTRKVPVQITRYEEEVQVRRVPVKTYKMVAEEQVRHVPVTVQKPALPPRNGSIRVALSKFRNTFRDEHAIDFVGYRA